MVALTHALCTCPLVPEISLQHPVTADTSKLALPSTGFDRATMDFTEIGTARYRFFLQPRSNSWDSPSLAIHELVL